MKKYHMLTSALVILIGSVAFADDEGQNFVSNLDGKTLEG